MEAISFTEDQIEVLRALTVSDRQIERLSGMLPCFKAPIKAAAPLSEVRGEIKQMLDATLGAMQALARGLHDPTASAALSEVQAPSPDGFRLIAQPRCGKERAARS